MQFIYIFDPLCSWSWSFNPVLEKLVNTYEADIQYCCGGMAIGNRVKAIGEEFPFREVGLPPAALSMSRTLRRIEFGEAFESLIQEGSYRFDSEPPSIAIQVFKSIRSEGIIEFIAQLQNALFIDGKDLNNAINYLPIIKNFGIKAKIFLQRFHDPAYKFKAYQEFRLARQFGAKSYPNLLIRVEGELYQLARGLQAFHEIQNKIESIQRNAVLI